MSSPVLFHECKNKSDPVLNSTMCKADDAWPCAILYCQLVHCKEMLFSLYCLLNVVITFLVYLKTHSGAIFKMELMKGS